MIAELDPDLQDDLRIVALNGKAVRRYLTVHRADKPVRARYVPAPASGACGYCMLLLHSE